ncbi:MAG TPA: sigma 54-interacting transcriptional regulator [Candidatus Krumholzibacteria bacterium]|nr:sigma 54-interacting transcriptional regulator [Candidatus Krumholzibacteria bacterium]HPD71222.1 sigma 54-interacting transcriptional regulator [Candidatus Krumholzibacteria bacterium]HRY39078.1 sigma 54-interacting transcriptional regulator [Candidatus Krumholzibacteria bacterium]
MAEFEAYDSAARRPDGLQGHDVAQECDRLEAVGDLHFQSAAYTTALDYYGQILPEERLSRLPSAQALQVLRNSLTSCLQLGWTQRADQLLGRTQEYLQRAVDLDQDTRDCERARIQVRMAALLMLRGDYQAALEVAKRAFTFLALTDQHLEVANLQLTMGACHQRLGRLEKAEEFYLDSLSTYRRVGDEHGVATLHNALAMLHKAACRWDRAMSLLDKAVALAERHGAPQLLSWFHLNRGIVLLKVSRFPEARFALEKSLRLCRSLGDRIREPKVLLALGRLELLSGRYAMAEEHILAGQILADRERLKREAIIADEYLGDVMLARGDVPQAQINYELGLEKARSMSHAGDVEGELLRRRAEARRRAGDLSEAVADAHAAVAICEKCGEDYELGFSHLTLGEAYAAGGDWPQADAHFRQAVEIFQSQELAREWCEAVCTYLEARLATADKPLLLILRRMLLDVQEQAAASVGDASLAACLSGLTRVQLRLGLYDDALLTVFELERVANGLEDRNRLDEVLRLRQLVENGLVGGLGQAESPVRALSGIPGLFQSADSSLTRHLDAILLAACERTAAVCGFLAVGDPSTPKAPVVAARQDIDENLAGQLVRWYTGRAGERAEPVFYSRLAEGRTLLAQVPALRAKATSCLFMPIAVHERRLGFLFLGLTEREAGPIVDQATLDFLANYMGFLALFLAEKAREPGDAPAIDPNEGFSNIITSDQRMLEMLALIRKVAASDLTVLLRGETGTGKGMLAYALHRLSPRADQRFQSINCAAIPETLLESELFGHVKGSFTGADVDKKGLLVEAEGGTVFLDEIGKMPLSMQGKLLHFLDTRVVRPVGSVAERQVDVRIVCASKADLHQLVESDRFLEDLYFRLLDFPLVVPPLRERPGDVPLLAHHFLQMYGPELCGNVPAMGADVLDALTQYDWPGNIRELEKCLKRALVLAGGEGRLRPEHLPRELTPYLATGGRGGVVPLKETLAAVESREIAQALRATRGNKSSTARLLRISYPSLLKKIRLYGLD